MGLVGAVDFTTYAAHLKRFLQEVHEL
jgi:hypothetical protein